MGTQTNATNTNDILMTNVPSPQSKSKLPILKITMIITAIIILAIVTFLIAKSFSNQEEKPATLEKIKNCLEKEFTRECHDMFFDSNTEKECEKIGELADKCFYKLAETTFDSRKCDAIINEALRDDCYRISFIPEEGEVPYE